MLRFATILIIFICTNFSICSAEVLRGVHIAATGNNKYEAKIRANDDGMTQALSLIADGWGIKKASFEDVPYEVLKSAFKIDGIIQEKSYDEKYTADVNYSYTNVALHNLMMRYGDHEVKKQFFNYVVIPVFKQKNVIKFLDDKTGWLSTWIENIDECKKYGLLPIDPTKQSTKITTKNIFKLSYKNFLDDLETKKFNKVLLAVCEYFTNSDGSMYVKITTESIDQNQKKVLIVKYDIAHPDRAKEHFDSAIRYVIQTYGTNNTKQISDKTNVLESSFLSEKISGLDQNKKAGSILDALLVQPQLGHKLTKVEMKLDVFSPEELQSAKANLDKVKSVVKYQINLNEANHYKITLYINDSMEKLAEGFYENNLSYKFYDGQYTMFELVSGI